MEYHANGMRIKSAFKKFSTTFPILPQFPNSPTIHHYRFPGHSEWKNNSLTYSDTVFLLKQMWTGIQRAFCARQSNIKTKNIGAPSQNNDKQFSLAVKWHVTFVFTFGPEPALIRPGYINSIPCIRPQSTVFQYSEDVNSEWPTHMTLRIRNGHRVGKNRFLNQKKSFLGFNLQMPDTKLRPTSTMKSKDKSTEQYSANWMPQIPIHSVKRWISHTINENAKIRTFEVFKNLKSFKPTSSAVSGHRLYRIDHISFYQACTRMMSAILFWHFYYYSLLCQKAAHTQ